MYSCCRECNPAASSCVSNCSSCVTLIHHKRRVTNGGNGLCAACEQHLAHEAAQNGAAPPPRSKRWEDVVLDELEPLVVDPDGHVITCEMRDSLTSMLGSNKRRRVGECDTVRQRRPDLLYLVRDADGHIAAALSVEVDEHFDEEPGTSFV